MRVRLASTSGRAAAIAAACAGFGAAVMLLTVLSAPGGPSRATGSETPAGVPARSGFIDVTRATIVTPAASLQERTAVRTLVEEVERTGVRLRVASEWPADSVPVIAVGPIATASAWASAGLRGAAAGALPGPEGYRVAVNAAGRSAPTVLVLGADARGVLFGVGRLLRELRMTNRYLRVRADAFGHIVTAGDAARPSARLSAQDQLLRRLGTSRCGSSTSATSSCSAATPSS